MALEHFTRAWESKSIQRHLLAVASLIIKAAVQATEEYLAVSGSEHAPRVMPVEQTFSTGNQPEGYGGGSHTTYDAVATSIGESRAKTSQATERLLSNVDVPICKGTVLKATSSSRPLH